MIFRGKNNTTLCLIQGSDILYANRSSKNINFLYFKICMKYCSPANYFNNFWNSEKPWGHVWLNIYIYIQNPFWCELCIESGNFQL
jgi:hypothetical protein